jgi:GIY-YIG catalytic domain.
MLRTIKRNRQNIKIAYKTNNKLNNIISNNIEQYNKYDRKGVYKLTCTNYHNFYLGRTNRNFNTRFKEHRKYIRYTECKSKFSEHFLILWIHSPGQ